MDVARFEDLQDEFLARISRVIYCTMATVDRHNRPRLRLMHPIWEGPIGWVISWPESHKARHLARNPAVSLAYMPDRNTPVYVEAAAGWVDSDEEKQRVWNLHRTTLPPIGFDPEPHYGSIAHPYFGVLKILPWRIELANLGGESLIWRPGGERQGVIITQ
jgi:general stress protein 26